ncbi:MAG: BatD family protein [Candidatus Methanoperedens sp.]
MPVGAVKTETFSLENYTGLNFMNGLYKIEVIEMSKPGDMPFVKVNLITGGLTKQYYVRINEDPSIKDEPFNQINLNSSFISEKVAMIAIQFPDTWGSPVKYTIEKPVIPEKIPNIVLKKSVDKTSLNQGDVVEFSIIVENTGNGTAYNLTLDEKLPQGFTKAAGSSFPPTIQDELKAGGSLEIRFALKAVESGVSNIEPTTIKYGSKTARSNSISLTIGKSNLLTVINLDKTNIFTGDPVEVTVKLTNIGNSSAEAVLIEGPIPKGMEVTEGDLRQVYNKIEPGESEEYSTTLKAVESGNYSVSLKTSYSDDSTGFSSKSDLIIVTDKEKNYLFILIPAILIIAGIALFVIRRHREYSY